MKIVIIGHGECGKDSVANAISSRYGLSFKGSISWYMKAHVAKELEVSEMTAWDSRRDNRHLWRDSIDAYREGDPARIIRECFKLADIVTGVRPAEEMESALAEGLIDCVIWVERNVPIDPTLELNKEVADVIIDNTGSLADMYLAVHNLSELQGGARV